jgi:hypothetical protein
MNRSRTFTSTPIACTKPCNGSATNEFTHRAQLAVAAALGDLEAVKFEPCHAVDERDVFEPVAKIGGHVGIPSR